MPNPPLVLYNPTTKSGQWCLYGRVLVEWGDEVEGDSVIVESEW